MTQKPSLEFEALGTHWLIECADSTKKVKRIHETIETVDKTWSRFRDDSVVADMARRAGTHILTRDDKVLLDWYRFLYDKSDGQVTPLIGQTLVDAGYDAQYSLQPHAIIRTPQQWDDVLVLKDNNLTIKKPALLDVGAAGKGHAIDLVAKQLSGPCCIDASGDILVRGDPMRIGLQDPRDDTRLVGVATVTNASLCGSAINQRSWGDWHHIINPKTMQPVRDIIATWVIADTAMYADGLATALFFVKPDVLLSAINFQYCVLYQDGTVRYAGEDIEVFIEGGQQ